MSKKLLNKDTIEDKNIEQLLFDSTYELSTDQLLSLIEEKKDLKDFPIEPMYFATSGLPMEALGQMLSLISKKQRNVLWHIDFWAKDEIYPDEVKKWIVANFYNKDESIKKEFLTSIEFQMFLKAIFNIWTFDVEDPMYPDHNNYFLTDDSLLLFEYKVEDEGLSTIIKTLIIELYSILGVEHAYCLLFKLVSMFFTDEEESLYQIKCDTLNEFGFLSHHESLELISPFRSMEVINFQEHKSKLTPNLESFMKDQTLSIGQLDIFNKKFDLINTELIKVTNPKRLEFLKFNFLRTINASYCLNGGLKTGKVALVRSSKRSRFYIYLGVEYLKIIKNEEDILNVYDFSFCYKIGLTLISQMQKRLKKSLQVSHFNQENISFFGDFLFEDYKNIFDNKFINYKKKSPYEEYSLLEQNSQMLIEIIPFISELHLSLKKLIDEGIIQDDFYLNINANEIDFENILINLFANYILNNNTKLKIGLSLEEFKTFYLQFFDKLGKEIINNQSQTNLSVAINNFSLSLGLEKVPDINTVIKKIISRNLEGYLIENLKADEFRHIGGIILLNQTTC